MRKLKQLISQLDPIGEVLNPDYPYRYQQPKRRIIRSEGTAIDVEARLKQLKADLAKLEIEDESLQKQHWESKSNRESRLGKYWKLHLEVSNQIDAHKPKVKYYELMMSEMKSSPEDLLKRYSTGKPSDLTAMNFSYVTDHEVILSFGLVEPGIDTTNYLRGVGSELFFVVRKLKTGNPKLVEQLDEELSLCSDFVRDTWMLSALYLNSLDIPFKAKSIYPSGESDKNFWAKDFDYDDSDESGEISKNSILEETTAKILDGVFFSNGFYRYLSFGILIGAGIMVTPFLLLGSTIGIIGDGVKWTINKIKRHDPEFVPYYNVFEKGVENRLERFWLYFNYHPEKDKHVNFDEVFNPTPEINPSYRPRELFKKKVFGLYETMKAIKAYYRIHEIPLDGPKIFVTRSYILQKMKMIDEFAKG